MIEYNNKHYYSTTELADNHEFSDRIAKASEHLRNHKCFGYRTDLGTFLNKMRVTGKIRYISYKRFEYSTVRRYAYCVEELEEDFVKIKKEKVPALKEVWDIQKVEVKE